MVPGIRPQPSQNHASLTIQVSVATTGDCISLRPKNNDRSSKARCFRCGLLPLLVITFCTVSTILSMYENTTVMNYMKKSLTAKFVAIPMKKRQPIELPYHIHLAIENEKDKVHRSFPRWGPTIDAERSNGIDLHPVMDFIVNSSAAAHTPGQRNIQYIPTTDHGNDVGRWYPEILYVLDHRGLHVSDRHRNIVLKRGNWTVRDKFIPTESKMIDAYRILSKDTTFSFEKWPYLSNIVLTSDTDTDSEVSGFPFLLWYGDYTGCNYLNWKDQYSIPLFTVAALDTCNYTFPFPNYGNSVDANMNWEVANTLAHEKYPWNQKLSQIVWRGGLTGTIMNTTQKSPRWSMMQTVAAMKEQYDTNTTTSPQRPFIFDFGATRIPAKNKAYKPYVHEVGGFAESMPMEEFQKYRGILDTDGNSWSMRFGRLLCYNSVILKVEPTWVEYFYYKDSWFQNEPKLQPWVHYIPVKGDLSDLLELSEFVVDPMNDEFLQTMVSSANTWCQRNVAKREVAIDMLNIWERYLQLITTHDPNWVQDQWKSVKEMIFAPTSPFQMSDQSIGNVYQ